MNEDWVETDLSEVCTYTKGKKPKLLKSVFSKETNIPYINIKAFEKGIFEHYTDGEKCNLCEDDDLLMVWDGARQGYTGKAKKGAVGSTLMKIEPVNGIEKNYLYYFLLSLYTKLNTNPRGVGIPHVEPRILWNSKFVICNSSLQKAIVTKIESLFSDLDNGIANLKKAQVQLKIYRQAVLKKAFEGELTKEWREERITNYELGITNEKLPTAEELLKQIKEERQKNYELRITNWKKAVKAWEKNGKDGKKPTKPKAIKELPSLTEDELKELPELPDGWNWVKAGIISYINPKIQNKSSIDGELEVQFIPMKLVEEIKNIIHLTEVRKFQDLQSKSYTYFENEDILFAKVTPCMENGKIAVAKNLKNRIGYGSSEFHVFRCTSKIFNYYLFNFIVQDEFRNLSKREMSGAVGLLRVPTVFLENYPIPIPSIPEQHQIVQEIESRLSVCDKMEQSISESLKKANALRQSILKKVFEGKLLSEAEIEACKQEEDYEPASVLLEKIKAEKVKTQNIASQRKTKKSKKNGK